MSDSLSSIDKDALSALNNNISVDSYLKTKGVEAEIKDIISRLSMLKYFTIDSDITNGKLYIKMQPTSDLESAGIRTATINLFVLGEHKALELSYKDFSVRILISDSTMLKDIERNLMLLNSKIKDTLDEYELE
jgi:PIN domain nuclease of toxin-antitoxin system